MDMDARHASEISDLPDKGSLNTTRRGGTVVDDPDKFNQPNSRRHATIASGELEEKLNENKIDSSIINRGATISTKSVIESSPVINRKQFLKKSQTVAILSIGDDGQTGPLTTSSRGNSLWLTTKLKLKTIFDFAKLHEKYVYTYPYIYLFIFICIWFPKLALFFRIFFGKSLLG